MDKNKAQDCILDGTTRMTCFCPTTSVPAWLRGCNGSVVELLHAIDVGNSDGTTAVDICKVSQMAYVSIMKLSFTRDHRCKDRATKLGDFSWPLNCVSAV